MSSLIASPEIPVQVDVAPTSPVTHAPVPPPPITFSNEVVRADSREGTPLEVSVDAIVPNPHQPRKSLNDAKVAELAGSIKSSGIIQPAIVRKRGDRYELIAGERRWRAAKLAGLASIPVIVREVSSFEQAQMALIENIQREDLNPIDRAESYRALITQLGLTQAELATRLGEDRSSIANYLRLLDLAESIREMIRAGQISLGHAKLLAGVDDPIEQEKLASLVKSQELSVRNLERLIANSKSDSPPDNRPTGESTAAHIQDLERTIARQLGMRAQLRPGARKGHGRLVLHYASLDQFDGLLMKLGIAAD